MNTWPAPVDYQDAIQNPAGCFADPELKAGKVMVDALDLPRGASGSSASVYQIQNCRRSWAVRCFSRPVRDQEQRYAALSAHIASVGLCFLVPFQYLPHGILVKGNWHPVLKMQWVSGQPLHTFVEKNLSKPAVLTSLADRWRFAVTELRRAKIIHGDLQHGNILILPAGTIALIDYDAMLVPGLKALQVHEIGHRNYQHPERDGRHTHEGLDNFSALVIDTSLRALAARPRLWQEFNSGENLIFSARDFQDPARSALFTQLLQTPAIAQSVRLLYNACRRTITAVPQLSPPGPAVPWWSGLVRRSPPAPATATDITKWWLR